MDQNKTSDGRQKIPRHGYEMFQEKDSLKNDMFLERRSGSHSTKT